MNEFHISCLAVTNRPAFRDWLLWNYEKQTYPHKSLVLIDGDSDVVHARNRALAASRGNAVAWFDDDDWSAPDRLDTAARFLQTHHGVFGSTRGLFVDLLTGRASEIERQRGVFFNGAVVSAPYPAIIEPGEAEDVRWVDAASLEHAASMGHLIRVQDRPLHFWLCHSNNLINVRNRHRYSMAPDEIENFCGGAPYWQDTSERLRALRKDPAVWARS